MTHTLTRYTYIQGGSHTDRQGLRRNIGAILVTRGYSVYYDED
jgi:hypothetical protein